MHRFSLQGKVAIITGASRGIGAAIARTYAQAGACVVLASRKLEGVSAVAEAIRQAGGTALPVAAHVGEPAAITRLVEQALAAYGGIDIVVNNAAASPYAGPLLDCPESAWEKALDVNLRGNFRLVREAVPSMEARGGGKIVNIASVAGLTPQENMGLYCVTKAAVIMLTKVLAVELAPRNIQVNTIAPGFVRTHFSRAIWDDEARLTQVLEHTPARRIGETDDLTGIALYLASSASSFMTGQTVVVDGGLTL
ncbi:MAG: glucose 1-dehydrogenase [Ktedonobacteraceae bacterium]|nr:glucose 1-dehydrogenase [Ktedonobacteraceae bacterium]